MQQETPQYLYKILSTRLWNASNLRSVVMTPAEDNEFIHFSTEQQLPKILDKYWSNEKEYAILKVDVAQLPGDLKFEANPGGSTRYYHLYSGYIPLKAIVETKIVDLRPQTEKNVILKTQIVEIGNPVLRGEARELSQEEILSEEIQNLIHDMQSQLRKAPGVGLAAPQIGVALQIIVVEDMDHSHLTEDQLHERDRHKVPYHVIINPKIFIDEAETAEFFEGCLSVPKLLGIVPRAKKIRVDCLNEKGEPVTLQAHGWYARILQHEIDHLFGTLFIDRAELNSLTTEENYIKFWKSKSIKEIKSRL